MRNRILIGLFVAVAALASARTTRGSGLEARRAAAAKAFEAAGAIPVTVRGAAAGANLRCEARVRYSTPSSGGRCFFNRVVTEVRLVNGQLDVSCGELEVACR